MLNEEAIAILAEAFNRNELSLHYDVSSERGEEIMKAIQVLAVIRHCQLGSNASDVGGKDGYRGH